MATSATRLLCEDLDATLHWFREQLGFRLDTIAPADDPEVAAISREGLRVVLQRCAPGEAPAPVAWDEPLGVPDLSSSFVIRRAGDEGAWVVGRAGMRYRDLIPDRQGGRYIASHIHIADEGPVPDEVHFHDVRFQFIYCVTGWVRLVYEHQGPPFVLRAGDCVLQPPTIRHRVLEASAGLEVVELACPARHPTHIDHDVELPSDVTETDRDYAGQRFVRHQAEHAEWNPWVHEGFQVRDTGLAAATDGTVDVQVVRGTGACEAIPPWEHGAAFYFAFVLAGTVTLRHEDDPPERLARGDAYVIPTGARHALDDVSRDVEILTVSAP